MPNLPIPRTEKYSIATATLCVHYNGDLGCILHFVLNIIFGTKQLVLTDYDAFTLFQAVRIEKERVRNSDPSLTPVEEGSNRVDREKGEKRKRETAKNSDLC